MGARTWDLKPTEALDAAITWFLRRSAIGAPELDAIKVNARRQAFWMARVHTAARAQRIQNSLQNALAHGMDFDTWRRTNRNILQRIPEAHLRTTFRNWTQTAYNASRVDYLSSPAVKKRRPYWVFDAVMDGATTPVCVAYNGTVLPAGHKWFKTHTPPLHHNCRSSIRGLTQVQGKKLGIRRRAPADKLTKAKAEEANMEPGTVSPQAGFGRHMSKPWDPRVRDVGKRPKPIAGPKPTKPTKRSKR